MTLAHYQWLGVMVVAIATALPVMFAGWWMFERETVKDERDSAKDRRPDKRKPMATIRGDEK